MRRGASRIRNALHDVTIARAALADQIEQGLTEIAARECLPGPSTLRDWFAGQALAGLPALMKDATGTTWTSASASCADRARVAYAYADAMLEARDA